MEKHHPGLLEEFKLICEHWNPYWTERIGGPQTEYTTQRVIDFFLASGTAEDINLQIAALESLGVKAISSVMFSIQEDLGMLERLSKEILPVFR